jgi:hypothetical protein
LLLGFLFLCTGCGAGPITFDGSAYPRRSGETRALVLWVRFADDVKSADAPVTAAARAWAQPDRLPGQASSLVSASSRHPTGLTEYFQSQSGGRFSLTGASFPVVLVSEENEVAYKKSDGTLDQGKLTRELLRKVDASGRLHLDDFDADRDGFVDYVFVIIRAMKSTRLYPTHASGVSDLGYTSEGPEFGRRSRLQVSRHASGSYVRYDNAGNIFPETDLVRLLAHEIGHDIWTENVHLLPVAPLPGIPSFPDYQIGSALMSGRSDARGDETISAAERDWAGWITCTALARDTTFVVRDLYSSQADNCFTMDVPQPGAYTSARTLYLSHRARIGPFDRLLTEHAKQARRDQGLMDTGLLVMAAETGGRLGPVPADGKLTLSATAEAYAGDLFRSGDRLTP